MTLSVGDYFYAGFNGSYRVYVVKEITPTEIVATIKGKEDRFFRDTGKMVGGNQHSYSICHKKI